MAHVVLLAGGRACSSGGGLTHLLFLFRASGTPHFSPTGKYKADGVLETVRLSGKLSCHLWPCLGTISFHISKSSPSWGWLAVPAAQAPRILPFGGGGEVGGFGDWLTGWEAQCLPITSMCTGVGCPLCPQDPVCRVPWLHWPPAPLCLQCLF